MKAQQGAGEKLPNGGRAFISVRDFDKAGVVAVAQSLHDLGFELVATGGTAKVIAEAGLAVKRVNKVMEGRPHIVDMVKKGEIQLIVNTVEGRKATADSATIRRSALQRKVYYTTTLAGAEAVCSALTFGRELNVHRLQDLHKEVLS